AVNAFAREQLGVPSFHPDSWAPVVIRDPADAEARLRTVAGPRYTYRDLDNFTDLIRRTLEQVPQVSKVQRSGVLPEQIFLQYSQARLAAYGLQPSNLRNVLAARNTTQPGGVLQVEGTDVTVDPSAEFRGHGEIADV